MRWLVTYSDHFTYLQTEFCQSDDTVSAHVLVLIQCIVFLKNILQSSNNIYSNFLLITM